MFGFLYNEIKKQEPMHPYLVACANIMRGAWLANSETGGIRKAKF